MSDESREPTPSELKAGYEGKPPIPLDALDRGFPAALGFKVRHADYFERVDGGALHTDCCRRVSRRLRPPVLPGGAEEPATVTSVRRSSRARPLK